MTPAARFDSVPCKSQADRQPGCAHYRDKASGLNAELRQYSQHGDGQNEITDHAAEEADQHLIEMRRPFERSCHQRLRFAGQPQAHNKDRNGTDDVEAICHDQGQKRVNVARHRVTHMLGHLMLPSVWWPAT
jgi:hypothetical protein